MENTIDLSDDVSLKLLPPPKGATSYVVEIFSFVDSEEHTEMDGFVNCNLCQANVAYKKSTSKLINHLFFNHREIHLKQ